MRHMTDSEKTQALINAGERLGQLGSESPFDPQGTRSYDYRAPGSQSPYPDFSVTTFVSEGARRATFMRVHATNGATAEVEHSPRWGTSISYTESPAPGAKTLTGEDAAKATRRLLGRLRNDVREKSQR